ncbi:hypothetical protein DFJ77DRAFT_442176 [Powellomyces hirtus]|nr:hypothetical protein DFJ77DRAFT_442176 [Powellomyces hirtus]
MPHSTRRRHTLLASLLLLLTLLTTHVSAFGFFDFFGDDSQQQQQQQQRQEQQRNPQASSQTCQRYQCPETPHCVPQPKDCPCPNPAEQKCWVGEWYVCTRGDRECGEVVPPTDGRPGKRHVDEL